MVSCVLVQLPRDPEGPLRPRDINVASPAAAKDPEVAGSICHREKSNQCTSASAEISQGGSERHQTTGGGEKEEKKSSQQQAELVVLIKHSIRQQLPRKLSAPRLQ